MNEAAESVMLSINSKIAVGHQLNAMESYYFLRQNMTLDNFVTTHYYWRYLTIQNLQSVFGTFVWSVAHWLPNHLMAINLEIPAAVYFNFNSTVCNDSLHFPGSHCNVSGEEMYALDVESGKVDFTALEMLVPVDAQAQPFWQSGPLSRLPSTWRSSAADLFSPGYTSIYPTPTKPTFLIMQVNVAVLNGAGQCVGGLGKDLSLDFVNTFLSSLVSGNSLLAAGGRAFVYEQSGGMDLIGASHGNIYLQQDCASCAYGWQLTRLQPKESNDEVIAATGAILPTSPAFASLPSKFTFDVSGEHYLHINQALNDEYGLRWMVSVVLSLTELFKDITSASMRMLGITFGVIIALSVVASLVITYVVIAPLRQLSRQMENVANMDLEELDVKPSRFHELCVMQGFFLAMVQKLKVVAFRFFFLSN